MSDEPLEPTSLRLPAHLLNAVRKRAAANRRSLNSEMIVVIERALEAETTKTGEAA